MLGGGESRVTGERLGRGKVFLLLACGRERCAQADFLGGRCFGKVPLKGCREAGGALKDVFRGRGGGVEGETTTDWRRGGHAQDLTS